jgi:hypothetical protein
MTWQAIVGRLYPEEFFSEVRDVIIMVRWCRLTLSNPR